MEIRTAPFINQFLEELDMYVFHLKLLLKKLDQFEQEVKSEFEKITPDFDLENVDGSEIWQKALKNIMGIDNFHPYLQKTGAMAGYCIVIFHLFERFMEECTWQECNSFSNFVEKIPEIKNHESFSKIEELRNVANFCKHGAGPSADELRKLRPDYFKEDFWKGKQYKPLSGFDLNINIRDIEIYVDAIKEFSEDLP